MKKRIISAIVMLMIFIPLLLLGNIYYAIFSSILGLIGLYELLKEEKNIPIYMRVLAYLIVLYLILYNRSNLYLDDFYPLFAIIIIFLIVAFSVIINNNRKKYNFKEAITLLFDIFLIGILFHCFLRIRLIGFETVLFCFVISAMTDTFAYLGGTLWGKRKLIPSVSPNKTVEGSITGSIVGTIISCIYYYFVISQNNMLVMVPLTFFLTIVSQMGDLFFSSIKRYYKIKDFSKLIPGHGGVLDRLDSTLFVILGFMLYLIVC